MIINNADRVLFSFIISVLLLLRCREGQVIGLGLIILSSIQVSQRVEVQIIAELTRHPTFQDSQMESAAASEFL